ncbi:Gfo/Idh/MocA family protein [Jannaschia aquimarina]|uniref:IdhA_2 protein n=1 Tax=Jannaschia aquimarina TaxID=935700 RepID=A0A0D1D5I8_9RHOB|nr:Gfo/Idh/MocA family oxidoreductase [Jannaschia aquimarina]KIT15233.1 Inositol 2-dehydrogenase [Jannaschia aquimarina]SNT32548.1 Predicted dehydrogenase [Jannaschia aquimarina]
MKVGLIGTGMVAGTHAAALNAAGLEIGPVLARTSAQAFVAEHGGEVATGIAEMAACDFVLLLTPPDARADYVDALAAMGRPVLAEKPLERDHAAALALVERMGALPFGVTLQQRMRPAASRLRGWLSRIGTLASVELRVPWWRDQSYYDAPGRGTYARDGGGVLITQAIHAIDLMLWLAGPVAEVRAMTATTALHRMEAEDFAAAALRFASGAVGSLTASVTHFPGGTEMLVLNGTAGSAVLEGDLLTLSLHDGTKETFGEGGGTGGGADPMAFSHAWHQAVIEDFAAALRQGRAPAIPASAALPAHALIDAIRISARDGAAVAPAR